MRRLSVFFKRHGRLLSFVGALIVFTTFVVKEGLNEHLKSVVDSLELANQIFAIRGDDTVTHARLNKLQSDFTELHNFLHRDDKNFLLSPQQLQLERLMDEAQETTAEAIDRTQSSAEDTASFLRAIPRDPEIERDSYMLDLQKKNFRDEGANLVDRIKTASFDIFMAANRQNDAAGEKAANDEFRRVQVRAADLIHDALSLQDSALRLREKALQASESYRSRMETRYRYATYLSYLLYTLGWGLGLAGRIFSVEGLAGGEE